MVLLLHVGDHVQDRVHVRWRRRHGQARDAPGGAVNQQVIDRQRHVHAGEVERHRRRHDWPVVAGVEASERRHRPLYPPPERVSHRHVRRLHQPRHSRAGVDDGAGTGDGVKGESVWWDADEPPADADADEVDVVEGGAPGVSEERGGFDADGLSGGAQAEGTGEVEGLEAGEAVGEGRVVDVLRLGEEGRGAAAQAEEALRWKGAAGDCVQAAKCVEGDGVAG